MCPIATRRGLPSRIRRGRWGLAAALLVLAVSACSAVTTGPSDVSAPSSAPASALPTTGSVVVTTANPYYPLVQAAAAPSIEYGTTIAGCVVKPETSCPGADLHQAKLQGALFDYSNLTGADLSEATLAFAGFTHATLTDANMSGTVLTAVEIQEASAQRLSLRGATLRLSSIANSDLEDADLQGLDANFGSVIGSNLRGAHLSGANLSDTDFNGDDLRGADLSNVNLANADLTGSTLDGARLDGASFCNTLMPNGTVRSPRKGLCPGQRATEPLSGPPLSVPASSPYFGAISALVFGTQAQAGTKVNGCRIQAFVTCTGAHLANADLQGGFLGYAKLDRADLSGANFYLGSIAFGQANNARLKDIRLGGTAAVNASFQGSDFSGAKLSLANFLGARLRAASFADADGRLVVFAGADLRAANLTRADLFEASFEGADLRGADLRGANLTDATLIRADLTGADLDGATFCDTLMPDGTVKNPTLGTCPQAHP